MPARAGCVPGVVPKRVVVIGGLRVGPQEKRVGADAWVDVGEVAYVALNKAGQPSNGGDVPTFLKDGRVFKTCAAGQKTAVMPLAVRGAGLAVQRAGQNLYTGFVCAGARVDNASAPAHVLADMAVICQIGGCGGVFARQRFGDCRATGGQKRRDGNGEQSVEYFHFLSLGNSVIMITVCLF